MTSRTKHALWGLATDVGGTLLLTAVALVATPIILRLTSQSLYGFWLTLLSILGYLALADFGIGVSLTRLVAAVADRKEAGQQNRVISTAFCMFCTAGLALLCLGLGISVYMPAWFGIPDSEAAQVVRAFRVAVVAGALSLPLSTFGAIVSGHQRMAVHNTITTVVSLAAIALSIVLLLAGWGLLALAWSMLLKVLAIGALNYGFCRRYFPRLRIRRGFLNKADLLRLASFGGYFQLGRIANTVAVCTDHILIGVAMGAASVVPYAMTSKLAAMFSNTIASKLPVALFPGMSQMFARGELERLRQVFVKLASHSTRLAIVAGVFVAVANRQFVWLWVGPDVFGGVVLTAVFVYWVLQDTLYRGVAALVYSSGQLRSWALVSSAEAVINLVSSCLLVGPLGLVGVALGTSIAKTTTTGWFIPCWICRRLDLSVPAFLYRGVMYPAARSLPGVLAVVLAARMVPVRLGWLWVVMVGVVAAVTNLLAFEGVQLLRASNEPWPERLRRLIAVS